MASKPIQVRVETKERLDNKKLVPMESYDHVINRVLDISELRE